jgi:hypothetical protein
VWHCTIVQCEIANARMKKNACAIAMMIPCAIAAMVPCATANAPKEKECIVTAITEDEKCHDTFKKMNVQLHDSSMCNSKCTQKKIIATAIRRYCAIAHGRKRGRTKTQKTKMSRPSMQTKAHGSTFVMVAVKHQQSSPEQNKQTKTSTSVRILKND